VFKKLVKAACFGIAVVFASPLIIIYWMGRLILRSKQGKAFCACAELLSLCPSFIGVYLRKAFYWAVCTDVSSETHFLFGSLLTHRENKIGSGTVVGHYTLIGFANIGNNVQMGARVSIVSGKYQHGRPDQRGLHEEDKEEHVVIDIGDDSWIGQDVVIMANVGSNCTVGAGSVVMKDVPDNTTVLGNPARKVNIS